MKMNRFATFLVIGLAVTLAASGCRKKPTGLTPLPAGSGAGATTSPKDPGPGPAIDGGGKIGSEPSTGTRIGSEPFATPAADPNSHLNWTENRDQFKSDTVYFDFDSSSIKDSERVKLSAVADFLKANNSPRTAVRVEGHCDERGTEGYNLSLGERRAGAVRDELIRLGIEAGRVETVSFGEDRPASPGHDEAAWRLNRRGELVLLTEPPK